MNETNNNNNNNNNNNSFDKPPHLKIKMYPTKNCVRNNDVFLPEKKNIKAKKCLKSFTSFKPISNDKTLPDNQYTDNQYTNKDTICLIEYKISLITNQLHSLGLEMEKLNKDKFNIYKNNRIQNTQWVSKNSIFVFPIINNNYESEYIRLNALIDYYKFQRPNTKKYNIYSFRAINFYDINRHHLKNFDFNIV